MKSLPQSQTAGMEVLGCEPLSPPPDLVLLATATPSFDRKLNEKN